MARTSILHPDMHNKSFSSNNYAGYHPVAKKLLASGPQRILSLDGGGIRGAISLGYLEQIELILRSRYNKPDLVLSDYFDLIGGTSTGAIIATLLALGKPVAEIKEKYIALGQTIFGTKVKPWVKWYFRYLLEAEFEEAPMENALLKEFASLTLGSESFKTGLCIFAKRADTYQSYAFHNHPRGYYYENNSGLLIRDLLRATSAAPSYFRPKSLKLNSDESAVFIDGGVSVVNNPALMLFLMATLKNYPYQWKKGNEFLMIISIGTGTHRPRIEHGAVHKLIKRKIAMWGPEIPDLFMIDATQLNQLMLQSISEPPEPEAINQEAGDQRNDKITDDSLLTYIRYNAMLEQVKLNQLGFDLSQAEVISLRKMEQAKNIARLIDIGEVVGKKRVKAEHLLKHFDFNVGAPSDKVYDQAFLLQQVLPIIKSMGLVYTKCQQVEAYQTQEVKEIVSKTKYGIETYNTSKPGDYIVTNLTEAKEQYIVSEQKFNERYTHLRDLGNRSALYAPIGKVFAIQVTQDIIYKLALPVFFYIQAPWNDKQYVSLGDYLVCPLTYDEIYRIGYDEFLETYKKY